MINTKKKIIIATGGTGGHVFPAYSLAKNLIVKDYNVEIITDDRGLKFLEKYKELKIILNNSATIFNKNKLKFFLSFFIILLSFLRSLTILYKAKPFLVFGMGGYASFPVCLAAKVLNIPYIIYENNLQLGKSNKYLSRFAYKILIAHKEAQGLDRKYLSKTINTGNIIREEILNYKPLKKNFIDTLNILILGGSQAAKSFGEFLPKIFSKCTKDGLKLKIFQQCTESQIKELENIYKNLNLEFEIFNFTNDILSYFSKTELVITRSGASMLAELVNCRMPFISIPYPFSADSHQEKNASYLEKKGYCFLIKENEVNEKLYPLIKSIYKDKEILNKIIKQQANYSDKQTFSIISSVIEDLLHGKNSTR
jgi:UDP-N-acetylglucosamine--N-acetylmuramyl-(pentapeptide) pyrophosphoryl-undecaprenol N-acetylglucosamine transferase